MSNEKNIIDHPYYEDLDDEDGEIEVDEEEE